jgi:hypothetical protein
MPVHETHDYDRPKYSKVKLLMLQALLPMSQAPRNREMSILFIETMPVLDHEF